MMLEVLRGTIDEPELKSLYFFKVYKWENVPYGDCKPDF